MLFHVAIYTTRAHLLICDFQLRAAPWGSSQRRMSARLAISLHTAYLTGIPNSLETNACPTRASAEEPRANYQDAISP
ncbi:hypothetical protein M8818_001804 [Zalaria obscura]|uniref:Uncharacterized protein n=1 Tax=Zalaria obscura TaxID=2024903 RepID=A0ACC3SJF1_9PEZI